MAFTVNIRDEMTPRLENFRSALEGSRRGELMEVMGTEAARRFRDHFRELDQTHRNKIGGNPTHFWAQAAKATTHTSTPEQITISVNQVGVRQRLKGGEIRAKTSQWLTIPADPQAYGMTALGDFRDKLRFVLFPSGTAALLLKSSLSKQKHGKRTIAEAEKGAVMFWLKKSVTQAGDSLVLPDMTNLRAGLVQAARRYLTHISARQGGGNAP